MRAVTLVCVVAGHILAVVAFGTGPPDGIPTDLPVLDLEAVHTSPHGPLVAVPLVVSSVTVLLVLARVDRVTGGVVHLAWTVPAPQPV